MPSYILIHRRKKVFARKEESMVFVQGKKKKGLICIQKSVGLAAKSCIGTSSYYHRPTGNCLCIRSRLRRYKSQKKKVAIEHMIQRMGVCDSISDIFRFNRSRKCNGGLPPWQHIYYHYRSLDLVSLHWVHPCSTAQFHRLAVSSSDH
ncbi:hypothetical protein EYC84_000360 [Monilinia fructicola]|uniref:Uncharacterized protein n=1 Tax=Monilinia fructicola TaxID=38448 RepID=A0A5M9JSE4_MONFR|nr:hypothetical protein EYC84_000360 [Monilinia fructicola]